MNLGIVAQRGNPRAERLASELVGHLESDDVTIVVDEATAVAIDGDTAAGVTVETMATCDLVVSIGGDGTFLYAARGAGTTPVMGVNLGEVGFLNAVSPDEAVSAVSDEVERVQNGDAATTHSLNKIQATGDGWRVPPAINEITVLGPQRGRGQGLDVDVHVDGKPYTEGHADGILVATPTGSTAYNLSEDGPLVHPAVGGFVITEMAGERTMPSLVVDEESEITISVANADRAVVVSDGRTGKNITPPTTVTLRQAGEPVHVTGPPLSFFAGLGKLE